MKKHVALTFAWICNSVLTRFPYKGILLIKHWFSVQSFLAVMPDLRFIVDTAYRKTLLTKLRVGFHYTVEKIPELCIQITLDFFERLEHLTSLCSLLSYSRKEQISFPEIAWWVLIPQTPEEMSSKSVTRLLGAQPSCTPLCKDKGSGDWQEHIHFPPRHPPHKRCLANSWSDSYHSLT